MNKPHLGNTTRTTTPSSSSSSSSGATPSFTAATARPATPPGKKSSNGLEAPTSTSDLSNQMDAMMLTAPSNKRKPTQTKPTPKELFPKTPAPFSGSTDPTDLYTPPDKKTKLKVKTLSSAKQAKLLKDDLVVQLQAEIDRLMAERSKTSSSSAKDANERSAFQKTIEDLKAEISKLHKIEQKFNNLVEAITTRQCLSDLSAFFLDSVRKEYDAFPPIPDDTKKPVQLGDLPRRQRDPTDPSYDIRALQPKEGVSPFVKKEAIPYLVKEFAVDKKNGTACSHWKSAERFSQAFANVKQTTTRVLRTMRRGNVSQSVIDGTQQCMKQGLEHLRSLPSEATPACIRGNSNK